jgi:hypothetical protein
VLDGLGEIVQLLVDLANLLRQLEVALRLFGSILLMFQPDNSYPPRAM